MATRFRTRQPVDVEALQWSGSNWHAMLEFVTWNEHAAASTEPDADGPLLVIHDTDSDMRLTAKPGTWVIAVNGTFSLLDPEKFAQTYEPVSDS